MLSFSVWEYFCAHFSFVSSKICLAQFYLEIRNLGLVLIGLLHQIPIWGKEAVFCNMGLSLSYNYSSRISEKFARIFGDAPSIFLTFLGKPLAEVPG